MLYTDLAAAKVKGQFTKNKQANISLHLLWCVFIMQTVLVGKVQDFSSPSKYNRGERFLICVHYIPVLMSFYCTFSF